MSLARPTVSIDLTQPIALCHAGQRELQIDPSLVPSPQLPARYLVQRLDASGRADHASSTVFAEVDQGVVVTPALPAWPDRADWRPLERGGRVHLCAVWPVSLPAMGVDAVHVESQVGEDDPLLVDEFVPVAGQQRVSADVTPPVEATRYRFVVVQGPLQFQTPWSAWVEPAEPAGGVITLLGVS